MTNVQIGFAVLGSIIAVLSIIVYMLHKGKELYEQEKSSLGKC